jgi:CubicO group peptidase (beta-lactamase class C family)
VTKQFTALAILMLQAEGKLNISDTVCKYVSNCPSDWQPITISNLLAHTSGIPDFTEFSNFMKQRSRAVAPEQLIARFKDKPLDFHPGSKFSYSNSGYVLLGYLVEQVSGESYGRFLQRHIFQPLKMTRSGYDKGYSAGQDHALGYHYVDGNYKAASLVDTTVLFSAGGLYSTVRDLYRWDRAMDTRADKLLPNAMLKKMFAPHAVVGDGLAKVHGGGADGRVHYGFGWFISREFGHLEYSHQGGIPGFTSFNAWFPKQHVYIIVLDNMASPDIFKLGKNLSAIMFGKSYTVPKQSKSISLSADALKKFVGTYQLAPKFVIRIKLKGDQLTAQATGQSTVPIYPKSKNEFFYKVVDAQITFVTDENGAVTKLVLHQNGRDIAAKKIN